MSLRNSGRFAPKGEEQDERISLRVPTSMLDEVDSVAEETHLGNRSRVIREAVGEYLAQIDSEERG